MLHYFIKGDDAISSRQNPINFSNDVQARKRKLEDHPDEKSSKMVKTRKQHDADEIEGRNRI